MTITKLDNKLPQLPARLNAAAYARVSSGKDAMLHSLAAQVSYYAKLIQSRGEWIYKGVYADEACTGTKDNRAEFKRLLADCRAGLIDLVITKSISRFARNTVDLLVTIRELKALGIDVYFEEQNIHTQSSTGEVLLTLLAGFAQEESHSVSENCKWRIRKRYEQGDPPLIWRMYGFDINDGVVTVNEEQAKVVRQIFTDYIGGLGLILIARKLNEQGIPAYSGGKWCRRSVCGLLKNEKLIGDCLCQKSFTKDYLSKQLINNKGQENQYYVEQSHPGIISKEQFDDVQRIMAERNVSTDAVKVIYPFTGKIVCGICGKHYRRKKNSGTWKWQCSTYLEHSKAVCDAKQVPEAILEEYAKDYPEFEEIYVSAPNTLTFLISDGTTAVRQWKDRSRAESWTDEMRENARLKSLERSGTSNG